MSLETLSTRSEQLNASVLELQLFLNTKFRHAASVKFAEPDESEIELVYRRDGSDFSLRIVVDNDDCRFTSARLRHRCVAVLHLRALVSALVEAQEDAEELLEGAAEEAERVKQDIMEKFR